MRDPRIAFDTPEKLKKLVEKNIVVEVELKEFDENLLRELKEQQYVHGASYYRDKLHIIIEKKADFPELLLVLSKHNVTKVEEYEPTLEDVFLKIVGE